MIKYITIVLALTLHLFGGNPMSIYDIQVKTIEGKTIKLDKYKGRVMLIVNVASKCGFTPQYKGLEDLHTKYHDKGLSILGFPCNQFLSQEPGTNQEIQKFCSLTYGVKFDMFAKINVNGDDTHPLYKYLKDKEPGFMGTEFIKWNFTKFLVDREGNVVKRYAPSTEPKELEKDIEKLL